MPTEAISRTRSVIEREIGSVAITDLGVHSCRRKRKRSGESFNGWSQHAWGNAWDMRVLSELRPQVNTTLQRLKRRGVVAGWIDYGDGQYHIDGNPRRDPDSTPPCAGGSDSDSDSETPPVLSIPRDDDTAQVPTDDEPPEGFKHIGGGVREGSPADKAIESAKALGNIGEFVSTLGDADTWKRVLWAVGGLLALVVAAVMLGLDLLPAGRVAGAVKGAVGR